MYVFIIRSNTDARSQTPSPNFGTSRGSCITDQRSHFQSSLTGQQLDQSTSKYNILKLCFVSIRRNSNAHSAKNVKYENIRNKNLFHWFELTKLNPAVNNRVKK